MGNVLVGFISNRLFYGGIITLLIGAGTIIYWIFIFFEYLFNKIFAYL
jgi:hypothetical protein